MPELSNQSAADDGRISLEVGRAIGMTDEQIEDYNETIGMSDENAASYMVYKQENRAAKARALRRRELYDQGLISDWR
jgi:hypothetical protein